MASSAAVQQLQGGTSSSVGMISRLRQYFEEKSKPFNSPTTAQLHHQR
jgi:hypothetical protein